MLVPPQGILIGANPALFVEQPAGDIYFEDYFVPAPYGVRSRILIFVLIWGVSFVLVDVSLDYMVQPNQAQGPWTTVSGNMVLNVVDHGQQHTAAPIFAAPLPHNNPPWPAQMLHFANNRVFVGFTVNWHHKTTISRRLWKSRSDNEMHYHQHQRRQGHGPQVPEIKPQGASHWRFKHLTLYTQVQNCRRAMR
ncbi:hypothetical protein LXA43DRAFT_892820 [Ganoderma leucocontextum]|nr:hypothetical protein LXA43DRAFT_892814 [Ganoderma leucocontextum]KAI1789532.1 hypothetical protein LXA43DRAFT_892820 [Ganoderma leucocontextum]